MSIKKLIFETILPSKSDSKVFSNSKVNNEVIKVKNVAPIVYNVTSFYEIEGIAKKLINKQSVIINLSNLKTRDKYRVIDFLSGVTFTLGGKRQKLEENIYIFTISDEFLCDNEQQINNYQ